MLKKCKKSDDVLFINASEHFDKGKRQNQLSEAHIAKIIATYQNRTDEPQYSLRVSLEDIADKHGYNLNISRYISTAKAEREIDLAAVHTDLVDLDKQVKAATKKHNAFLMELGLLPLPFSDSQSESN